jgi:hypothetical protein
MSDLPTATAPSVSTRSGIRWSLLRWLVSFAGFPLGGAAAIILTGPVDSLGASLGGGLVTGAVLGGFQSWALGRDRPRPTAWVVVSAVGLMVGLGLGATLVDYRTGLGDLVLQGAVCGAVLGAAQAAVLMPRVGAFALLWPVALSGIWAAGWAVSTSIGIQVDEQFTVFGSSGAAVVTLLTAGLPLHLNRLDHSQRSTS